MVVALLEGLPGADGCRDELDLFSRGQVVDADAQALRRRGYQLRRVLQMVVNVGVSSAFSPTLHGIIAAASWTLEALLTYAVPKMRLFR